MSKVKRILAVVLAMAMVMAMSLITFAADKPSETDAEGVTIDGLDTGATLQVVQIIDAVYSTYGLDHYEWTTASGKNGQVTFDSNGNVEGLTSNYITTLAKTAQGIAFANGDDLSAGTWLVLATSSDPTIVYNPMIVSVYYTENGVVVGSLNASSNWKLETTDAYAKKSDVDEEFKKKVTGATHGENNEVLEDAKDVQVGDKLSFQITGVIPSYSDQYENPTYTISDKLESGLENYENIIVKVNDADVTEGETTYSKTQTDTSFSVAFAAGYIKGLAGKSEAERTVTITYTATVTEAASSTHPATNTATINYSHKPGEDAHADKITKTYTFELDSNLTKVDENGDALAGATFTLYRDENLTEEVGTADSDATGNIKFTGLDARTYYLKETNAPEGYQLNETVYTVAISATYGTNGEPTNVTVAITDPSATGTQPSNHVNIQNTKLSALPSTGGIGTTIFTVVGCLIMIAAAAMFFMSRRKAEK